MKKQHIFVSYVREDKPYADRLVRSLRKAGEAVWYDEYLLPGGKWKPEIRDKIDGSYAFILCCSTNLKRRIRSGVFKEIEFALSNFRELPPGSYYFFPVCFDKVDLPKIEVYEQQYLQDVFQKASIYADKETQNKEFGRLVTAIRKSPYHPAPGNQKSIPAPEQIPPPVQVYFELLLQWLLDPKISAKLFICFVTLILSFIAIGPIVQAGLAHASQDGEGPRIGTGIALAIWFSSCLAIFRWKHAEPEIAEKKYEKTSRAAHNLNNQNLSLKDKNQFLRNEAVSLRNQVANLQGQLASSSGPTRMSKKLLWGMLLTVLWWFLCGFVLQELLSNALVHFDSSFESNRRQYLAGAALGILGQFIIVRYFSGKLIADKAGRLKVVWLAFLIGLLPGVIWLLMLSPESSVALANESPGFDKPLGTNLLVFNAIEKLVVVPTVSLFAIVGLRSKS